MNFNNRAVIAGRSAVTLAVSTSAAETAALEGGTYAVWCGVDAFLRVAPVATGVTAANGYKLFANTLLWIEVPAGCKIGAIAGGAGTLSYHRVQ